MVFFKDTFRIGILAIYTNKTDHDAILTYKKELDNLGYEIEVLMYVDGKELPKDCFLPIFCQTDINKHGKPYSPRTDRFTKKKLDMLFNLYFADCNPLHCIATESIAKCRYGAYRAHLKPCSDVFVYTDKEDNLKALILKINEILQKQAYERKHF